MVTSRLKIGVMVQCLISGIAARVVQTEGVVPPVETDDKYVLIEDKDGTQYQRTEEQLAVVDPQPSTDSRGDTPGQNTGTGLTEAEAADAKAAAELAVAANTETNEQTSGGEAQGAATPDAAGTDSVH